MPLLYPLGPLLYPLGAASDAEVSGSAVFSLCAYGVGVPSPGEIVDRTTTESDAEPFLPAVE